MGLIAVFHVVYAFVFLHNTNKRINEMKKKDKEYDLQLARHREMQKMMKMAKQSAAATTTASSHSVYTPNSLNNKNSTHMMEKQASTATSDSVFREEFSIPFIDESRFTNTNNQILPKQFSIDSSRSYQEQQKIKRS